MIKKLFIVSLGCPKNLVDSEVMLGSLVKSGFSVCQSPEEADLILVNTCGFIKSAAEEAVDEVLRLAEYKKENPDLLLAVTGCLVQRYGDDLAQELPEVDIFLGTGGILDIAVRVEKLLADRQCRTPVNLDAPLFLMDSSMSRVVSTPAHRAYVKITDGCSNSCSYCMIPAIRGKLRSRPLEDIIKEVHFLESRGVQEITLVGQDLTAYGLDFGGNGARLPQLLQMLVAESAIPWVRMLYLYPNRISDLQLELMAENPRLLPYLDIPLQHVSPSVLRRMNRPSGLNDIDTLFGRIRSFLPEAAIRTTFIVGFPGETESDIVLLEDFLLKYRLNHVGVFPYSNEDGSAAAKFSDQCPEEIKNSRLEHLMTVQADISLSNNQAMIGRVEKVLVEGVSRETELLLEGRTKFQAPDIDGCVYINSGNSHPGEIVDVRFTEVHTYDLVGEIVRS